MQFVHLRNQSLRRIDTLYADIDLIRAERIDDNDKTFFADFYLSMNDRGGASIDQIEFSNAYLEPGSNDRQITVRVIHDGGKSDAFPDHMKIYQVTRQISVRAGAQELSVRYANVLDRYSAQARQRAVHCAAAAGKPARPIRYGRWLAAERPVCRIRRGFRAHRRCANARAERRALLQGELRVADVAADDRLFPARRRCRSALS